jgi:WD40 repeat protein
MLEGHSQDVKFILWHPSSCLLFSCSYDDTIKIWGNDGDGDDWRCIDTLIGHNSTVWSLGISYDGQKVVSCSDDLSIVVWECDGGNGIGTWRASSSLKDLHSFPIYSVNWNHQSNMIATGGGDNSITFCKLANSCDGGGLVLEDKIENAHNGDVNCVRWNPNDELSHIIASCGDDGTVRLWSLI